MTLIEHSPHQNEQTDYYAAWEAAITLGGLLEPVIFKSIVDLEKAISKTNQYDKLGSESVFSNYDYLKEELVEKPVLTGEVLFTKEISSGKKKYVAFNPANTHLYLVQVPSVTDFVDSTSLIKDEHNRKMARITGSSGYRPYNLVFSDGKNSYFMTRIDGFDNNLYK